MKILEMTSTLDPRYGGPVAGLRQMAKALNDAGHVVDVLTLDAPGKDWESGFSGQVHAVGPSKGRFGFTPRLIPWLKENASGYDAVVVNGVWQYHGFGAFWALPRTRVPYFVYTHGMLDPWFKSAYPVKHLKKWLYWIMVERHVLSNAAAILFTSEEEQQLARSSFAPFRGNDVVVSFGIASPPADRPEHKERLYSLFPELRNKQIVLFVSRIHRKKGCDLLLKAFADECNSSPNLHLLFVGPDDHGLQRELEATAVSLGIRARVTWTGMVSEDIKWTSFRIADVFALPSHSENFGAAVVEALSCGLPVLVSTKVNIWREIVEAGAGFSRNDDLDGTRQLLKQWRFTAQAQREEMRQKALECFLNHFEITKQVTRLVEVLKHAPIHERLDTIVNDRCVQPL